MNEVIQASLYDFPKYYDLVFGSDWKAEFDFLVACFDNLAGRKVRRVFEPACGTGRLVYRLAKAGYEVSGLDLNPRAVEYCNRRLERRGLAASAFVGDMADFRLPRKVDAAFNMIGSFRHLLDGQAAQDSFTSAWSEPTGYQPGEYARFEIEFTAPTAQQLTAVSNATAQVTARVFQGETEGAPLQVGRTIDLLTTLPFPEPDRHRLGYFGVWSSAAQAGTDVIGYYRNLADRTGGREVEQ